MTKRKVSGTQEQKIQSLQHSILFLQEQHAATLSGLHEEIEKLQQKCVDLTYQVSCGQSSSIINEQPSCTGSLKTTFEAEIRDLRCQNAKLKDGFDTKEKRIALLEGQLKSREQKYHDDIRNVERKVAELQIELDHKSHNIVYLTSQLHQHKLRSNKNLNDPNTIEQPRVSLSPSPPQGSPPRKSGYNLRHRSTTSPAANVTGLIQESSSHQLIVSDYVLQKSLPKTNSTRYSRRYKQSIEDAARPSMGHSHARRERELRLAARPKPSDYEDFIKLSQSQEVISRSSVEPLPPITTRSGRRLREPIKARACILRGHKAAANSSGEVETIIVENTLTSPERTYRTLKN